jgi:hypothetical protein
MIERFVFLPIQRFNESRDEAQDIRQNEVTTHLALSGETHSVASSVVAAAASAAILQRRI